jgi:hypothetical protein
MDSKVVRAVFWQRTDSPPGSNMLRLAYADSGSACKLAGVQIIPLPSVANQILARTLFKSVRCPRWRIKFSVERFSNQSAAHVGESNSRSNVVQISPLPTLANQILARTLFRSVAHQLASPAVGKFSRASSAGGRRHLQEISQTGSCRSPRTV